MYIQCFGSFVRSTRRRCLQFCVCTCCEQHHHHSTATWLNVIVYVFVFVCMHFHNWSVQYSDAMCMPYLMRTRARPKPSRRDSRIMCALILLNIMRIRLLCTQVIFCLRSHHQSSRHTSSSCKNYSGEFRAPVPREIPAPQRVCYENKSRAHLNRCSRKLHSWCDVHLLTKTHGTYWKCIVWGCMSFS